MFDAFCNHQAGGFVLMLFTSSQVQTVSGKSAKELHAPIWHKSESVRWSDGGLFRVDFSTRRVSFDMDGGAAGGYRFIILIT